MKFTPLAAALALGSLTAAALPTAVAAEEAAKLTIETPIQDLMADEKAKAVVLKHVGPIDQHPAYEQFKAMSLKAIAPFSQGAVTEETLMKVAEDLAKLK
ncbi:MAG: hypothetical protein ABJP70_03050 [Erythrobacter sp.]